MLALVLLSLVISIRRLNWVTYIIVSHSFDFISTEESCVTYPVVVASHKLPAVGTLPDHKPLGTSAELAFRIPALAAHRMGFRRHRAQGTIQFGRPFRGHLVVLHPWHYQRG